MRHRTLKRPLWMVKAASLVAIAAVTSACGLASGASVPSKVGPGSITPVPALQGLTITVGSKDFTENVVLGYLAEYALVAAGADVRDLTGIQGSTSARNALTSNQIDLYWDYTGTGWITYLGNTDPIVDRQQQFDAVAKADLEKNNVVWTDMAPLDNTYAFAMNREVAQQTGVKTISDIARLAKDKPSDATFCVEAEFANRNDGMPGVEKKYGFDVPKGNVQQLDTGAIYQATKDAKACKFGEVFTTDGRIKGLDLQIVQDDRKFFPRYNGTVTMLKSFSDAHPQVAEVLKPVSDRLTSETMTSLNAEVDVDGKDPAEVAKNWMVQQGFVS